MLSSKYLTKLGIVLISYESDISIVSNHSENLIDLYGLITCFPACSHPCHGGGGGNMKNRNSNHLAMGHGQVIAVSVLHVPSFCHCLFVLSCASCLYCVLLQEVTGGGNMKNRNSNDLDRE